MVKITPVLFLSLVCSGCSAATPPSVLDNHNGKARYVARRDLRFQGDRYELRHSLAHPFAGAADSGVHGDGGEIRGAVCGADLALRVWHRGDHVALRGVAGGARVSVSILEEGGARHISGYLGDREVDLRFDDQRLWGRVAGEAVAASLSGQPALLQMPPADQAVLLPLWAGCAADRG